jgi:REP element-mobilizing transposase RayT
MSDHVHILISIPPKYSVAQVVGFIKGKSAISIARTYMGRRKHFTGQSFWARGYYVSTVGRDEETVRNDVDTLYRLRTCFFNRFISFSFDSMLATLVVP